jgi:hypothetical protein
VALVPNPAWGRLPAGNEDSSVGTTAGADSRLRGGVVRAAKAAGRAAACSGMRHLCIEIIPPRLPGSV